MSDIAPRAAGEVWLEQEEKGRPWSLALLRGATRVLGRRGSHAVLWVVCLYYTVLVPRARRASNDYFRRLGHEAGFWTAHRHIFRFAQVALDRMYLLSGRTELFEFGRNGSEHIRALVESGRGGVLLGAHLGSFEAMRAVASANDVRIGILAHNANAQKVRDFLQAVSDGKMMLDVIEIDPGDPSYIIEVQERIAKGHLIAVLGDRLGINERNVEAPFIDAPARFPAGPFILASVLKCPVVLVFGRFEAPNRYDVFCEPFAEQLVLPRGQRDAALRELVARYAARVEHHCRRAPDNWFNFYDFWNSGERDEDG